MLYKYKELTSEQIKELLPKKDEVILSLHGDADGIAAGVLASYRYDVKKTNFPTIFGDVGDEDIMMDMAPNADFSGLVVDHHPPSRELPNATVIAGDEPTSLIAFSLFKEYIPVEHWWKMAVGMAGDGQSEKIPNEVWSVSKCLLDNYGPFVASKGTDYYFGNPVWMQLSSGVNALARADWKEKGYDLLKNAETPYDILRDPMVKEYKDKVNAAIMGLFKESKPLDLGNVVLWQIDCRYNVTGILAARLNSTKKKTAIVLNTSNNSMSIRGVLAYYVKEQLQSVAKIGGHPGFCGGSIKADTTLTEFINALRGI